MKIENVKIEELKAYEKNAKKHPEDQITKIAASIKEFGFNQPLVIDKDGEVIVGHGRLLAATKLGLKELPCIRATELTDPQIKAYRLADNKLNESGWDMREAVEELKELQTLGVDITLTGFDLIDLERYDPTEARKTLREQFIIPPMSIWDTRQGYWQDRKRQWKRYIGDSREGREKGLLGGGGLEDMARRAGASGLNGTSEFDAVVAEICYRWFSPEGGKVLDPFAGGVVRGAVAATLGRDYTGIDLSKTQIETNKRQMAEIVKDDPKEKTPDWKHGNSKDLDTIAKGEYDFIFSCPPYYDLEIYNDGPGDLSTAETYEGFLKDYREIIKKSIAQLKENRFACFVVGDIRDKEGYFRGFVNDTIQAFEDAGAKFYNDCILVNAISTASLRAKRNFALRKVTRVHQNVLAFYKGDPKEIEQAIKELPKIGRAHNCVVVFYKGEVEEIRKNYAPPKEKTDENDPLGSIGSPLDTLEEDDAL